MNKTFFSILAALAVFILPLTAHAMGSKPEDEFQRIIRMSMGSLTDEAHDLLEEKYPDEDWEAYNFPEYVHTNDSVEAGYKIAVKRPEILKANFCYCFCNKLFGHTSLLSCFWKDGVVGGEFDDHATTCNVCFGQAMATFLLDNAGATEDEIRAIWLTKYKSRAEFIERKEKEEQEHKEEHKEK